MDICGNVRFCLSTVYFGWQCFYAVHIVDVIKNEIGRSSILILIIGLPETTLILQDLKLL